MYFSGFRAGVENIFFLEGGSSKFDLGVGMGEGGDLSQYMGGALGVQ